MVRLDMVHGFPKVVPPNGVCEGCILRKHQQENFEKGSFRKCQREFVHNDLCTINQHSLVGASIF